MLREAACLQLAERLFQSFAPLNENHFLPFFVPLFDNLRSVGVLRSLCEVLCEFLLNKLRKYELYYIMLYYVTFSKLYYIIVYYIRGF